MRHDAVSLISSRLRISKERFHQNYEIVGRAMIVREGSEFIRQDRSFAHLLLSSFKLWSVYGYRGVVDRERKPVVRLIDGIHTDVTHLEDGVIYRMDPEKVMFSKGNKNERHLLTKMAEPGETVLDMFSGIGYFSIPISFRVKRVYACEINPDSFHYLIVNIRLNGAKNVVPMLGDSSELGMKGIADRIIMGHFDSPKYLDNALRYLKERGKIHMHLLAKKRGYEKVLESYRSYDFVHEAKIRKVKSYSPSYDHVALDLEVIKH